MARISPYLSFNGNCEEAFNFYKSVFGGEFKQIVRYKETPPTEGYSIPESAKEKIMHVSLPISKEINLMGCDANPQMGSVITGQNISLTIGADNKQEADRIFNKLSEGGKVTMPMTDTWWNSYFGMLSDKFNINWMVDFEKTVEEQKTRQREHSSAEM